MPSTSSMPSETTRAMPSSRLKRERIGRMTIGPARSAGSLSPLREIGMGQHPFGGLAGCIAKHGVRLQTPFLDRVGGRDVDRQRDLELAQARARDRRGVVERVLLRDVVGENDGVAPQLEALAASDDVVGDV